MNTQVHKYTHTKVSSCPICNSASVAQCCQMITSPLGLIGRKQYKVRENYIIWGFVIRSQQVSVRWWS